VVPISIKSGAGLDALRAALRTVAVTPRQAHGDRSKVEEFKRTLFAVNKFDGDKYGRIADALRVNPVNTKGEPK
jgi:hypothetical protein